MAESLTPILLRKMANRQSENWFFWAFTVASGHRHSVDIIAMAFWRNVERMEKKEHSMAMGIAQFHTCSKHGSAYLQSRQCIFASRADMVNSP